MSSHSTQAVDQPLQLLAQQLVGKSIDCERDGSQWERMDKEINHSPVEIQDKDGE